MHESEIMMRIKPIANGFLVTASKEVGDYATAWLPQTYVATREEVVAGLPSLFEAANELSEAEGKDSF